MPTDPIKWNALAETWYDAGPPASPSAHDLQLYETFIREATTQNSGTDGVLMLGCTPSLRSLILKLQIPLTCVDLSQGMLAKTSALVSGDRSQEQLICQDWLEMYLGQAKYAAIVGDKFMDNVPHTDWSRLKRNIERHLAPGGYLITRVAPQDTALLSRSFRYLLESWATYHEAGTYSTVEAASGLWEQCLGASAATIPGRQSVGVFEEEIREIEGICESLPTTTRAIFDRFRELFQKSFRFEWTAYTLGNVIDLLSDRLALVALGRATDYLVGCRQPILMFKLTDDHAPSSVSMSRPLSV